MNIPDRARAQSNPSRGNGVAHRASQDAAITVARNAIGEF
jgi:hypothetical protein